MKRFLRTTLALSFAMAFALVGCKHESNEPTPTRYTVEIPTGIANGSVSADKQTAQKDEIVTLTLTASENYKLGSISVKDASNNIIETTAVSAGTTYTFVMPESNVSVSATFKSIIEGIEGSQVFIEGRNITIRPTLWASDHEVTQKEY